VAEAGEARLSEPGIEGDWSLKDIIAHITYYERWQRQCGGLPRGEPQPQANTEGLKWTRRMRASTSACALSRWDQVLQESQASFQRSIEAVQGLRNEDLYDPKFIPVPDADWTVFDLVEGNTFEHYNDHSASVRAWLDRTAGR